jgi:hypothetical protein
MRTQWDWVWDSGRAVEGGTGEMEEEERDEEDEGGLALTATTFCWAPSLHTIVIAYSSSRPTTPPPLSTSPVYLPCQPPQSAPSSLGAGISSDGRRERDRGYA